MFFFSFSTVDFHLVVACHDYPLVTDPSWFLSPPSWSGCCEYPPLRASLGLDKRAKWAPMTPLGHRKYDQHTTDGFRVKLKTNLNLFELRQNDLNRLLDAITLLSWHFCPRLQKEDDTGDAGQYVDLVAVCRFQALGTFPQSPLKRLIPLVRKVTKLFVTLVTEVSLINLEGAEPQIWENL